MISTQINSNSRTNRSIHPSGEPFIQGFGAHLLLTGALDDIALQRSSRAARQSGERLDYVLIKLGLVSENDLYACLSTYLECPLIASGDLPAEPVAPDLAPERFVRTNKILPLTCTNEALIVAVVDPFDTEAVTALSYATGRVPELRLLTPALFEKAVADLYANDAGDIIRNQDFRTEAASEFDLQRLRDIANEAPVIRRVNQLIAKAIETGASDIHIEPGLAGVQVRYRVDGALRSDEMVPTGLEAAVASRIKIMSGLDIAERRLPQDGRVKLAVRGVDIDFRISTMPTTHGESIVMRVLDRSRVSLDFDALGFEPPMISELRDSLRNPNGIILVTGPTGSGKTTTLYTALKELNTPAFKIFTVEDPVEYQLPGINQVQIQPAIGLDFPAALRAILRQDPDIIMIGEIRDAETARIAIQASLTGHLVLSTLHTNGAAASITRLLDMGVESYLIASTVKAVLAQRLVRRLCPQCARPMSASGPWVARLCETDLGADPNQFKVPVGCSACGHSGYAGRSTIAELLRVNENIHALICERASESDIDAAARHHGMRSLYQDGMAKASRGVTSVDDVLRVTRVD